MAVPPPFEAARRAIQPLIGTMARELLVTGARAAARAYDSVLEDAEQAAEQVAERVISTIKRKRSRVSTKAQPLNRDDEESGV